MATRIIIGAIQTKGAEIAPFVCIDDFFEFILRKS